MVKQTQMFYKSMYLCVYKAVNHHKLILYYSMSFLLFASRIICLLSSFVIYWSRNLLLFYGRIYSIKARKPGKYCSTSLAGVRSLFLVMLYIFYGIGRHYCLTKLPIFCMSLYVLLWSKSKRTPSANV